MSSLSCAMARPAYAERVHGEIAALNILGSSAQLEKLDAPIAQFDALWHYQCVVSPRSPASNKLHSNPASPPRSPAASPRSRDSLQPTTAEAISVARHRLSPPSHAVADLQSCATGRSPLSPSRGLMISPPSSGPFLSLSSGSPPLSPRSHAASSSAAPPPPLSRFGPPPGLQHVFSTFDENGDGCVSTQEISRIFQKLGISKSEDSIQSLLADSSGLVTESQGHVDEEEFVLLFESACSFVDANASSSSVHADLDQDLLAAFHVFDKDGNGFISPAELQSVLCSLGFSQGRQLEACADMIARVDENGDGQVDFFEFKKLFHMENPFMTTVQSF